MNLRSMEKGEPGKRWALHVGLRILAYILLTWESGVIIAVFLEDESGMGL